jgi:proteasome assembly chaperone (PAC2) family protein
LTTRTLRTGIIGELKTDLCIVGLPGWGNVGRGVLDKIIKISDATLVANILSHSFPDIMITDDGFSSLPSVDVYVSRSKLSDTLLVTSRLLIDVLPTFASYELLEGVVRLARQSGCKLLISVEGVGSHEDRTFVIGNSRNVAEIHSKKMDLPRLHSVRLPGYSGILLSLSRLYKMDALGIIRVMSEPVPNAEVNTEIFRELLDVLVS